MINSTKDQFRLSIDKISITFRDHDPNRIQRTGDRLIHMVESGDLMNAHLRKGKQHKLQCEIPINGTGHTLLLQVGARYRDASPYRAEYNPSKIGNFGRSHVQTILSSVFEFGGHDLLMAGKVTRIDVALDLNDLSVDDVLVRQRGMRKFTVVSIGGCPRSLYHGGSRANQAAIYDRPGEKVLRIEKRLKPNCLGADLAVLNNPFALIQLVPVHLIIPVLNGLNLEHLCDSIRLRGFPHVLRTLPRSQRQAIKKILADPAGSLLPSAGLVWSRWIPLLNECDLLSAMPLSEAAE